MPHPLLFIPVLPHLTHSATTPAPAPTDHTMHLLLVSAAHPSSSATVHTVHTLVARNGSDHRRQLSPSAQTTAPPSVPIATMRPPGGARSRGSSSLQHQRHHHHHIDDDDDGHHHHHHRHHDHHPQPQHPIAPRFDDWFASSARRLRAVRPRASASSASATLHTPRSPPSSQSSLSSRHSRRPPQPQTTTNVVGTLRCEDWFSVEARAFRQRLHVCTLPIQRDHPPLTTTHANHPPRDSHGQLSHDTIVPASSSHADADNRRRHPQHSTKSSPKRRRKNTQLSLTHTAPRRANTRHTTNWIQSEIQRLALSADDAEEEIRHHSSPSRVAAGLLWVVQSAAAAHRHSRWIDASPHFSRSTTRKPTTTTTTTTTRKAFTTLGTEDLLQEGAAALVRALQRWDPHRSRITTYSYVCAKYAMQRAIENQARPIRIPVHAQAKLRRLWAAQARLEKQYSIEAAHLALHARSSPCSSIDQTLASPAPITLTRIAAEAGISVREAALLLVRSKSVLSIDAPVVENSDTPLHDILVDRRLYVADAVEDKIMLESLRELVRRNSALNERERIVLLHLYGLHNNERQPLPAKRVAVLLGISIYKVRVAERAGLAKLRADLRGVDRDAYHEWMASHG